MNYDIHVAILAAGKGSRMQSPLPKPMLHVGSKPMIAHVLAASETLCPTSTRVVIGPDMQVTRNYVAPVPCVVQHERLGTGHAVQVAFDVMPWLSGTLVVLNGDVPLITGRTLQRLVADHQAAGAAVSVLGFETDNPGAYGRLISDGDGLRKIVESKDALPSELAVTKCNGGIYAIDIHAARQLLPKLSANNAAGELYLTDLVGHARDAGLRCGYTLAQADEMEGANTVFELAKLDQRFLEQHAPLRAAA